MVTKKHKSARRRILVSETSSGGSDAEEIVGENDNSRNRSRSSARPTSRSAHSSPSADELHLPVPGPSDSPHCLSSVVTLPSAPSKRGSAPSPLWNLWTIWDTCLKELTRPSSACRKRLRMSRDEFGNSILRNLKTLSPSFQFPPHMSFVTIEVTGEPSVPRHRGFTNIPIRFCQFEDLITGGDWTLRAILNLGVLLSLTFKIGEIVVILGGIIDYEEKIIYLNKSPVKANIVHLADDANRAPRNCDIPFNIPWSQFAIQSKFQLVYSMAEEFTILKTSPYLHEPKNLSTSAVTSVVFELTNINCPVPPPNLGLPLPKPSTSPSNINATRAAKSRPLVDNSETSVTSRVLRSGTTSSLHLNSRLNEKSSCDDVDIIPETPPITKIAKGRRLRPRDRTNVCKEPTASSTAPSAVNHSIDSIEIVEEIDIVNLEPNNLKNERGRTRSGAVGKRTGSLPLHTAKRSRLPGGFLLDEGNENGDEDIAQDSVVQNVDNRANDTEESVADNANVVSPAEPTESTSLRKSSTDHNWRIYWRPEVKHKRYTYDYHSLQTYKDRLEGPATDNGKGQPSVYGVVAQILKPDRPTDYKIRISDETLKGVLVRIHISGNEPQLGPEIDVMDIIRIHRCNIQNEVTERGNEMVISTGPHHNFVLFNGDENVKAKIFQATSAKTITFSPTDRERVYELREFINGCHHSRDLLEPEEESDSNDVVDEDRNLIPDHTSSMNLPNQNPQSSHSQATDSQDGIHYSEFCRSTDSESFSSQIAASETFSELECPVLSMVDLTRDQQRFTMKCVILGSVYTVITEEICIRVSDGTVSEHLTFFDSGRLPDTLNVFGVPHVDIVIRQIHENPDLWYQISNAEVGTDFWLLTNIKIVPREDQSGLLELFVDARQSSLERFVEYSQTDTDPDPDSSEILPDELNHAVHETSVDFASNLQKGTPSLTSTPFKTIKTKQKQLFQTSVPTSGSSSSVIPRIRVPRVPPPSVWPFPTPSRPRTTPGSPESDSSVASELEVTVLDASTRRKELFPNTSPVQVSVPVPENPVIDSPHGDVVTKTPSNQTSPQISVCTNETNASTSPEMKGTNSRVDVSIPCMSVNNEIKLFGSGSHKTISHQIDLASSDSDDSSDDYETPAVVENEITPVEQTNSPGTDSFIPEVQVTVTADEQDHLPLSLPSNSPSGSCTNISPGSEHISSQASSPGSSQSSVYHSCVSYNGEY